MKLWIWIAAATDTSGGAQTPLPQSRWRACALSRRWMARAAVLVIVAFSGAGCAHRDRVPIRDLPAPYALSAPWFAKAKPAICEAALRHLFDIPGDVRVARGRSGTVWFVSIDDSDPSKETLDRFAGNQPPVRPGSEFRAGAGVFFNVHAVKPDGPDSVTLKAEDYFDTEGAHWYTLRLELRAERWTVVEIHMDGVS